MRVNYQIAGFCIISLLICLSGFVIEVPAPHYAKSEADTMQVPEGFVVQQFAAEPLVTNPTNMEVDERGRVWVTESHNYDVAPAEFDKKGDKVVILEDADGDGKADKSTVFFEHPGLKSPMGLLLGEDRVYLAQAPYLLMLFDTNHDDRADRIDTLFSGFGARDHGIHAPFWGPDGKLYFSMGNHGGDVLDKQGTSVLDVAGNPVNGKGKPYWNGLILRCNPDGSQLETIAHNFRNQYEPALDSYGNLWVSDNDDDGNESVRINYVLEYGNYGFADEMTGAAWTTSRTNLEKTIPERHWHQNDPGVVPNVLITGSGSPAGLCFYEGEQWPASYRGQLIHAEALHNVVRSYYIQKKGAGYQASIRDVLKSRDRWFRPVDVSVAPDGSVLVADWYDPGIGGGTAADADKGRIYRISYGDNQAYQVPKLGFNTPEAAAEALKSPNWAARRKAWSTLKKAGTSAETELEKLHRSNNPLWQARALWLLAKLENKGTSYLTRALRDPNPDIRITALRAARQLPSFPFVLFARLDRDSAPEVRREWAIALRSLKTAEAAESWATLAIQHTGSDRWYLEALGIGSDLKPDACLDAWLRKVDYKWNTPAGRDIVWRIRSAKALPMLAQLIRETSDVAETLRYFRAFDFHQSPTKNTILLSLLADSRPDVQRLALEHMDSKTLVPTPVLEQAIERALATAGQTESYVHLVDKFNRSDKQSQLLDLVRCCAERQVGVEALQLLWRFGGKEFIQTKMQDDSTAQAIMTALRGNGSPDALALMREVMLDEARPVELRKKATRVLGSTWVGERYLLDEVKQKSFPEVLKPSAASVLFGAYRNEIKREAADYLPKPAARNGEPLDPIYLLVDARGVPDRGKMIFTQNCQVCHRVQGSGVLFGPELSKIGAKLPKESLFRAILYPDEGINHGYETYLIQTRNEGQLMGLINSESNQEVVLKLPGGLTQTLSKANILSQTKVSQSMMPSFSEVLSQQELIDLVAYLESLK